MTLDRAIKMLKDEYENALESEYVNKPLAYALFQVWKAADRAEKNRRTSDER